MRQAVRSAGFIINGSCLGTALALPTIQTFSLSFWVIAGISAIGLVMICIGNRKPQ